MKLFNKFLAVLLIIAMAAGLVVGCGSGDSGGSDKSLPPLRLGGKEGKFTIINPLINPWYEDGNFFVLTHTPLVIYKPDLSIAPGLAEKWEISPDGKSITFVIRNDARWSDGEHLTLEDIKFSYGILEKA